MYSILYRLNPVRPGAKKTKGKRPATIFRLRALSIGTTPQVVKYHFERLMEEVAKINETEGKIMSVLQQDGRMEFTELAKVLGISTSMAHPAML